MEKVYLILTIVLILVIVIGIFYWKQNQDYKTKMVRMDACISICPTELSAILFNEEKERRDCMARCQEKYGLTMEEFNLWKDKQ